MLVGNTQEKDTMSRLEHERIRLDLRSAKHDNTNRISALQGQEIYSCPLTVQSVTSQCAHSDLGRC